MSSSDSDDDEKAKFADCVYEVRTTVPAVNQNTLATNRVLADEAAPFDYRTIRVSDKVKEYISKHLDQILSNDTKYTELKNKSRKRPKTKTVNTPVKLLTSCEAALDVNALPVSLPTPKRKKVKSECSDKELERRAREVAVDPEFVLSRQEVKSWAPETRGVLEILQVSKKAKKKKKTKVKK